MIIDLTAALVGAAIGLAVFCVLMRVCNRWDALIAKEYQEDYGCLTKN